MPHFKSFYPSEYLQSHDLMGKEVRVTIERIVVEEVPDTQGKKTKKPVVYFAKAAKRFPLPKTCAKVIAAKFGANTDEWVGKVVTLYPDRCMAFGQEVDCVRLKA